MKSIAHILLPAAIVIAAAQAFAQPPSPEALLAQAGDLSRQGKYAEAIDAATKALAGASKAYGANDPRFAAALEELAQLYELQGDEAKAESLYVRALTVLEASGGSRTQEIAGIRAKLARISAKRSAGLQLEEAAKASRDAASVGAFGADSAFAAPAEPSPAPARPRAMKKKEAAPASAAAGARRSVAANRDADTVPFFPWPPPASSARYVFPQEAFSAYPTVGEVSAFILKALEHSGYVERSFFQTEPGGVALVTRLEKIAGDGAPAPEQERWPAGFDNTPNGFIDFVRGLFYAKAGHYRVIVFVLQEKAFTQSERRAAASDAETWLAEGAIKLPAWLASRPFGKDSTCTALIYEFESDGNAVKSVQSSLTGKQHLQKAGLLAALAAPY